MLLLPLLALSYTELVSQRAPFIDVSVAGHPIPPSWPTINASTAWQMVPTAGGVALVGRAAPGDDGLAVYFALPRGAFGRVGLSASATLREDDAPIVVAHQGHILALVTSTGLWRLSCTLSGTPNDACALSDERPHAMGVVRAVSAVVQAGVLDIWFAADSGLFRQAAPFAKAPQLLLHEAVSVLAWDGQGEVVVGNGDKIWDVDAATGAVMRWEWVSLHSQANDFGGIIDGAPTALTFGPALASDSDGSRSEERDGDGSRSEERDADAPLLYIGTPSALSIRSHARGYQRIAEEHGLPLPNVTALAHSSYRGVAALWVGTPSGLALWTPSALDAVERWRYLAGPRWLVGEAVRAVVVVNASTAVLTESGVTWLTFEEWTLARKAAGYDQMLARHDRHGLTAECKLVVFGAPERGCVSSDNDNNGLWTSLVVVAQYMRHRVTGEPAARKAASTFFGGMVLLNRVTGQRGLVARSACDPHEKNKTCAARGTWIHDKTQWVNSSAAGYAGWIWKSDASSDETTGHVFALLTAANLSPDEGERRLAARLLVDLVSRILTNGYRLIDITGKPTTWGRWDPAEVNGERRYSDERGLQSLQIVAYIAAAANVTALIPTRDERGQLTALWWRSLAELTNATNQYLQNMLALKITWPKDDNYSDDELAFLPFFCVLFACQAGSECAKQLDRATLLAALGRLADVVRIERSALWNAIELAVGRPLPQATYASHLGVAHENQRPSLTTVAMSKPPPLGAWAASSIDDLRWNLRTWQLELIEWPVSNSQRRDLPYAANADRFGRAGNRMAKTRPPIPANERRQDRWNANVRRMPDRTAPISAGQPPATPSPRLGPCGEQQAFLSPTGGSPASSIPGDRDTPHSLLSLDATARLARTQPFEISDGWDGMVEGDPGAWLLPYWMARFYGLLTAQE